MNALRILLLYVVVVITPNSFTVGEGEVPVEAGEEQGEKRRVKWTGILPP